MKINPPVTEEGTLFYQMSSNATLDTSIDFSAISSDTNGLGVYLLSSTQNDKYPIYYYRGAVDNNNVLFANFCWKMVRTTETGGIKLIYSGIPTDEECNNSGASLLIGKSVFNESNDNNAYVGYMYGVPGSSTYAEEHANINSSTMKTYLDNWYLSNLKDYSDKLEDTVWCYDRSLSAEGTTTSLSPSAGSGTNTGTYGAYRRLITNKSPSLDCPKENDKFTVSTDNGNGDLKYPIGLLTADEVAYSGVVFNSTNTTYYLFSSSTWWLGTPYGFKNENGSNVAGVWRVVTTGYLGLKNDVTCEFGVRPAISLKPGTTYSSGTGTVTDPYVVS